MRPDNIVVQRYYSNGAYGRAWGVRLVTAIESGPDSTLVAFKGVAGQCRRKTGNGPLDEFAAWAKYEVALNENSWQRVGDAATS